MLRGPASPKPGGYQTGLITLADPGDHDADLSDHDGPICGGLIQREGLTFEVSTEALCLKLGLAGGAVHAPPAGSVSPLHDVTAVSLEDAGHLCPVRQLLNALEGIPG